MQLQERASLVVLDVQLPGMDGIQLFEQMCAHPQVVFAHDVDGHWPTDNLNSHILLQPIAYEADTTGRERPVNALCSRGDVGQFRNEEALGGLALHRFASTVIALGSGDVRMAHCSL